jgi:Cu-Zn family superoxide dismutase
MKSTTIAAVVAGALALVGCSRARPAAEAPLQSVRTALSDVSGRRVGDANLQQLPHGVLIIADFASLPSGTHAIHIHETGQCTPPFTTAGGHFNPTGARHGFRDASGPHAGDLPNIHVPASGVLRVELMVPGLTLTGDGGVLDADGGALVVHQFADDYASDPAGASGDRIACGVVSR